MKETTQEPNKLKTVKDLLVVGTPTGYKDYRGTPYTIGCAVAYTDNEGFPCETELVVRDNFSIGIDTYDRTVDVNKLHESLDYYVV